MGVHLSVLLEKNRYRTYLSNMRILATCCLIVCVLVTSYLCWAFYRIDDSVLETDSDWPRPWPFPDEWLLKWHNRLDAAYPAPRSIKIPRRVATPPSLLGWLDRVIRWHVADSLDLDGDSLEEETAEAGDR